MRKTLFFFVLLFLNSCSNVEEFKGIKIRQYATTVIEYSSQYTSGNWSANKVLGKEDVYPNYGDNTNAWAPGTANANREYLVLGFDTLQTVHTIEVYETYTPGAIDSVLIRKADTQEWIRVYSKPAVVDVPEEARIFSVYIMETTFLIDALRIALDCPTVTGWNEIDAVAITGQRKPVD